MEKSGRNKGEKITRAAESVGRRVGEWKRVGGRSRSRDVKRGRKIR